eukprot:176059_1
MINTRVHPLSNDSNGIDVSVILDLQKPSKMECNQVNQQQLLSASIYSNSASHSITMSESSLVQFDDIACAASFDDDLCIDACFLDEWCTASFDQIHNKFQVQPKSKAQCNAFHDAFYHHNKQKCQTNKVFQEALHRQKKTENANK